VTDRLSPAQRSAQMSRIRSADTKPELVVRRLLHHIGYRYRLHVAALPGRPDLVFHSRRKVIFVHGCFWHQHAGCADATLPKTRTQFWRNKLHRNVQRDQEQQSALIAMNWAILIVWECELVDQSLSSRLAKFLGPVSAGHRARGVLS
jgi:DNA mismatch endonuclease (patch repair protein)